MINTVEKLYSDGVWTNTYRLTYSSGEIWDVPHSEENRHYKEILEWVAEGNTITDNGGAE
jgi:hypothetical protein